MCIVKRLTKKAIGRKHYTLEQLVTLLNEIEAVINTRPLTYYVHEELNSGFTLTPAPSHFLMGCRKLGLCPSGNSDYSDDPDFQFNNNSVEKRLETWKKAVRSILEDLERAIPFKFEREASPGT